MGAFENAEKSYIARWAANAEQHYNDKDYDWLCDLLDETPYRRLFEIGCGTGHSTLAFCQRGYKTISIDKNKSAIEYTHELLGQNNISVEIKDRNSVTEGDASLWHIDLLTSMPEIVEFLSKRDAPIDLIVLCNPGGNVSTQR